MAVTYIYALIDPRDEQVFYVGKTSMSLSARLRSHIDKARKRRTPKEKWIDDLLKVGYRPQAVELAQLANPTDQEVATAEQAWIDFYQASNPQLTNVGFGGQGGSGSHRLEWTPELDARLGTVPDHVIAGELGCDRKSVAYRREKLGIPRCPQTNFVVPPMGGWNRIELPQEIIDQLGTMPDYKLGEIAGVSKEVIKRHREKLGIPSYAEVEGHPSRFQVGQPHPRWSKRKGLFS